MRQKYTILAYDLKQIAIFVVENKQSIICMFERTILSQLELWMSDSHRKPLVLRGARQVGKTTIVHEFGKRFDNYLYLNLEKKEASALFDLPLPLKDVVPLIFAHCGKIRKELFYYLSTKFRIRLKP